MKKLRVVSFLYIFLLVFSCHEVFAASNLEEGVNQLAGQISKSMQEKQSRKIAIIDFSDLNGRVTALGQFLAEELTTQLFMIAPGKFEVVERRQLLKLQEELALGQKGLIEEKSIKKMGRILGVDAIVTGSMTDLGNTVKINARLIGVESAKVFAVAATDIPKTGMVADLMAMKEVEAQGESKNETQPIPEIRPTSTRQGHEYNLEDSPVVFKFDSPVSLGWMDKFDFYITRVVFGDELVIEGYITHNDNAVPLSKALLNKQRVWLLRPQVVDKRGQMHKFVRNEGVERGNCQQEDQYPCLYGNIPENGRIFASLVFDPLDYSNTKEFYLTINDQSLRISLKTLRDRAKH